jgi:hypothetical protein
MATNIDPNNPYQTEILGLERQRDLAKALLQKGLNDNLQGQMVSGRYVGASPWEGIADMYMSYKGGKMLKESDTKQQELANALRQQELSDIQKYTQMYQGTPAKAGGIAGSDGQMTTQTTPDMYGANMELNAPYKKVEPTVAQAANPEAANIFAASSYSPVLRQVGLKKITEGPQWKEISQLNQKTGNTETFLIDTNSPTPESTKRFVGISKPSMTAYERTMLADQGIGGGGGGNQAPAQTIGQGSPILSKPNVSLAPNAPPYAQSAVSMQAQPTNSYTLIQDYNKSLVPPAGIAPKAQREWNIEANKPLTGEPAKQVSGAVNTIQAIDDYRKILGDYSKLSSLSPEQRTNLSSAYNTMILQSKEANALGVLNGQDYEILKTLVPNPNDVKNLLVSNDVLNQQAAKQRDFLGKVVVNAYGIHQKKIPDYVAGKIKPLEEPKAQAKVTPPAANPNKAWMGTEPISFNNGKWVYDKTGKAVE